MGKFKELIAGTKFNRLTLVSATPRKEFFPSGRKKYRFECLCDCGNSVWLTRQDITTGHTKSCGCFRRDERRGEKGESGLNSLFSSYKSGAKTRGYDFQLTIKQFKKLTSQNCSYCGLEPSQLLIKRDHDDPTWGQYFYNGIDRVDNTLGYILSNCAPCCKVCNIAKHELTKEEFIIWLVRAYKHLKGN